MLDGLNAIPARATVPLQIYPSPGPKFAESSGFPLIMKWYLAVSLGNEAPATGIRYVILTFNLNEMGTENDTELDFVH